MTHGSDAEPTGDEQVDVLVIEDHVLVAESLARAVRSLPLVRSVTVVHSGRAAIEEAERSAPDLIVADVNLPDMDGVDVCREILAVTDARALVLTAALGSDVVHRAVAAGCEGFVAKSASLAELERAVTTMAEGHPYFTPDALRALVTSRPPVAPAAPMVSEREREVLQLLSDGRSVDEIATHLGLSPHTVRNHIRRAMEHLGVHSRLEAVVVASKTGLIDLE